MDKKQVAGLLNTIQHSYPGKFKIGDAKKLLEEWSKFLLPHDEEVVTKNLQKHVESNPFPPSISDLVKQQTPDRMQAIPNAEETKKLIEEMTKPVELSEEAMLRIKQCQAEIRKTLGIDQ